MVKKHSVYLISSISGSVIGSTIVNIISEGNYSFEALWLWSATILGSISAYSGWINRKLDENYLTPKILRYSFKVFIISFICSLFFFLKIREAIAFCVGNILGKEFNPLSIGFKIVAISTYTLLVSQAYAVWDILRGKY